MSDMSTYSGNALLNWVKGTNMPAAPATVYAALFNGDPDASGVEVTGTISLTRSAIAWGAVASRSVANNAESSFGFANAGGTVSYVAIFDAASGGNQISKKAITAITISSGEKVAIASGALQLTY